MSIATRKPSDDDILGTKCSDPGVVFRVNVDDFDDPAENEITREEIHLTMLRRTVEGEGPDYCLKLSTVSAKILIAELTEAIRKREAP